MSRKWLLFLFCLVLLVVFGPLSRAALSLRVNESAIKVLFAEQGTRVVLPIENSLGRQVDAKIKIEIVNPDNVTVAAAETSARLNIAGNEVTVPVSRWLKQLADDTNELLWYRLRYSVKPAHENDFEQISNVVSLSEITPDIFTVDLATARYAQPGSSYRLRVKTAHPQTAKPVAGINIEAQIKFEGSDRPDAVLKQTARTDGSGFATIDFQIPRTSKATKAQWKSRRNAACFPRPLKAMCELIGRPRSWSAWTSRSISRGKLCMRAS
jgi:hypothetical protein